MDKDLFLFKLAVKPTEKTFKVKLDNGFIDSTVFYGPCFGFVQEERYYVLGINNEPNRTYVDARDFKNILR